MRRELHARRAAERHREAYQRRYQALFEQNVAGVFRTTVDGEILDCNQALAELLGYERPEEVVGTDAATHYADPDQREVWIEELRDDRLVRNFELHLRRRDGSDVWALMNAGLIEEEETRGPLLAGTMVDVTEEKQLRDELEAYAYHDSLTGLPNRRYLKEEALAVLSKARRDGAVVALLYLDLNRFKRINDTLGHDAGDDVLGRFQEWLEASELRPGSLVLEVTESTAMQDPRGATQVFRNLQDRGARVAIDDFGTGHSALAYLKSLPVDLVKLDIIFVRGIEAGRREDRLLRALIELGRTLEVVVVAEGVEHMRQYSRLAEHRCELTQGLPPGPARDA